ncbi:uncharacterized protein K452DRAFT_287307 [Aplosporella prunicola CBS 121167]|uniref:3-beta hydroxysteroid dehydrogenase/isomerase domain-containing protein n=1 Tax=Aplosporella prunicola CBS 121167 TaxID=1176127 RepID=A0A6A6BD44_9PEZI|nr:uncharacterized protein K452DRAFT_287307 [Aplosporella prunicola CBS 121167]KAF2142099.1 hypothetical protein K452DRAFT_287307 [Aplosporella prunicola CBS 121167]
MPGERILITGGAGFLGSTVVAAFLDRHPEFLYSVLDSSDDDDNDNDAAAVAAQPHVEYLRADVRDAAAVLAAVRQAAPTVIVHTAGVVPVGAARYSQRRCDRDALFAVNVDGTRHVLDAARRCGVKALVYTSSSTVVTDDVERDFPNMDEATAPVGGAGLIYGQSKAAAEALVLAANTPTLLTLALRPSVLFGPGDTQLLPALHGLIPYSTAITLGAGSNLYDFTYVDNAAHAHVLAVEHLLQLRPTPSPTPSSSPPSLPAGAGHAFFVSNAAPVPFRAFCLAVWARFNHTPAFSLAVPAPLAYLLGCAADAAARVTGAEFALSGGAVADALRVRYACVERAREVLGYAPLVGLEEGVRRACADYERRLAAAGEKKKD